MDMTSSIAAASVGLKQAALGQAVSTSVMKTALDTGRQNGADMVKLLQSAATPHLGANIDIQV